MSSLRFLNILTSTRSATASASSCIRRRSIPVLSTNTFTLLPSSCSDHKNSGGASSSFSSSSSYSFNTTIRYFSSSSSNNPLDAFRDQVDRQTRGSEPVGRSWSVKELRRKSYDDLHKLWYVLYKERNMLLTEQQLSRTRQLIFPQPERFKKVQKSMGAIKQVLGERKREKIAKFNEQQQQSKVSMEEEMIANIQQK